MRERSRGVDGGEEPRAVAHGDAVLALLVVGFNVEALLRDGRARRERAEEGEQEQTRGEESVAFHRKVTSRAVGL